MPLMQSRPYQPVSLTVSIVLHRSSLDLLGRAMDSLAQAIEHAMARGQLSGALIYLIDNASGRAYCRQLEQWLLHWPRPPQVQVRWLPQGDNRGFGYGHNLVLEDLASDYHLVLNPDVEFARDALDAGIAHLQGNPEVVLASPGVAGSAGEQEFLCKAYPSVLVLLLRGFAPAFLRRLFQRRLDGYELRAQCAGNEPVDVSIASGCCMLLRTDALRAVAGFDEAFFLYFEDFDLSLRLQSQGRLQFVPAMQVVHHGGYAASKGRDHIRWFVRSGVRFFRLHGWRWF